MTQPIDLAQFDGHTPGPWFPDGVLQSVLCGDKADPLIVCRTTSDDDVCHVGNKPDGSEAEQCRKNTLLIAAAPALLAECRRLRAANAAMAKALQAYETQRTKLAGYPLAYEPYLGVSLQARAALAAHEEG